MFSGYEESMAEEEFLRQQEYEAVVSRIKPINYDNQGVAICPDCGCSMLVPCDEYGVVLNCDSSYARCCNCGTVVTV